MGMECPYCKEGEGITVETRRAFVRCGSCGKEYPEFGWYGAGFSVFKGEELIPEWIPPYDDEKAWFEFLDGGAHAHADYPDEEAMAGILEGNFTQGESFDNMVFRVLKFEIYDQLHTLGILGRWQVRYGK